MSNKEIINAQSKQEWLEKRVNDVTSTEVSALFGLSPYLTEFELYHKKKDRIVSEIAPSERMKWGTRLESAIAKGAAEEFGWQVEPMGCYMRDADLRIGSSFDFKIVGQEPGICEIKNVSADQFSKVWVDHGDGQLEAPPHIELQVQHQLLVSGMEWAAICALVGGNSLHVAIRKRDEQIGKKIIAAVGVFWARVEHGKAPSADYSRDSEFILQQLANQADAGEVMVASSRMEQLLKDYRAAQATIAEAEARRDAAKAEFLTLAGTSSKVISEVGTVSCGMTKATPGKPITQDMVGQMIGDRSGYRMFRFNAKKGN